jgi:predicted dehydrogenase
MTEPLRIGVLGLVHDHVWDVLPTLRGRDDAVLVAAADPHAELRKRLTDEYGCPAHADYDAVLNADGLDAVYVYTDNRTGAELVERAAGRGLHVMIEKPLAATRDGAERALAAAEKAGVRLMVNWPFQWWPQLQYAMTIAREGHIGEVWQVKYRAAHEGPREMGCSEYFSEWLYDRDRNGGGAFIDYCCYGAMLARQILGMPESVTGFAGRLVKRDLSVDDNGIVVMQYPHATAIAEGSWSQIGKLTAYVPTIYGTRGTLMVEPRIGGRLWLATEVHPDGVSLDVPAPPTEHANPTAHFVHAVRTGAPFLPLCDPAASRDAQAILAAGYESAASGRAVPMSSTAKPGAKR